MNCFAGIGTDLERHAVIDAGLVRHGCCDVEEQVGAAVVGPKQSIRDYLRVS
jgi:hypothetical protein